MRPVESFCRLSHGVFPLPVPFMPVVCLGLGSDRSGFIFCGYCDVTCTLSPLPCPLTSVTPIYQWGTPCFIYILSEHSKKRGSTWREIPEGWQCMPSPSHAGTYDAVNPYQGVFHWPEIKHESPWITEDRLGCSSTRLCRGHHISIWRFARCCFLPNSLLGSLQSPSNRKRLLELIE